MHRHIWLLQSYPGIWHFHLDKYFDQDQVVTWYKPIHKLFKFRMIRSKLLLIFTSKGKRKSLTTDEIISLVTLCNCSSLNVAHIVSSRNDEKLVGRLLFLIFCDCHIHLCRAITFKKLKKLSKSVSRCNLN